VPSSSGKWPSGSGRRRGYYVNSRIRRQVDITGLGRFSGEKV
jgi:hypothetical protein